MRSDSKFTLRDRDELRGALESERVGQVRRVMLTQEGTQRFIGEPEFRGSGGKIVALEDHVAFPLALAVTGLSKGQPE